MMVVRFYPKSWNGGRGSGFHPWNQLSDIPAYRLCYGRNRYGLELRLHVLHYVYDISHLEQLAHNN